MPTKIGKKRWSTDQWEAHLGAQVRRARKDAQLSQSELATRANVTRNSVSALERGTGSSLVTLIRVTRALGLEHWLDELAPDRGPSPLERLREQSTRRGKQ